MLSPQEITFRLRILSTVDQLADAFEQYVQGLTEDDQNNPELEEIGTMVMGLDAMLEEWRFDRFTNKVIALGMIVDKMGLTKEELMDLHEQRKAKAERQVK